MFDLSAQQVLILLVVVVLIFGRHRFAGFTRRGEASPLQEELRRHMPVFSAETTRGKEAEFIRDRLPKRFPYLLLIAVLMAAATLAAFRYL